MAKKAPGIADDGLYRARSTGPSMSAGGLGKDYPPRYQTLTDTGLLRDKASRVADTGLGGKEAAVSDTGLRKSGPGSLKGTH